MPSLHLIAPTINRGQGDDEIPFLKMPNPDIRYPPNSA